mgnify:FL=1
MTMKHKFDWVATFRVSRKQWEQFVAKCRERGLTPSTQLRLMIAKYLREDGDKPG